MVGGEEQGDMAAETIFTYTVGRGSTRHYAGTAGSGKTLCGQGLQWINRREGFGPATCRRCLGIETRRRWKDEAARETIRKAPVPLPPGPVEVHGFQVEGRRGGDWVPVPDAWYGPDYRQMAIDRADTLGALVGDSEFRVWDLGRGTVVYQRSVVAVPSGTGWPGAGLVMGTADYGKGGVR